MSLSENIIKDSYLSVPAPAEGLAEEQVARITDVITSNSDYTPAKINVIAVMEP